MTVEEMKNRKRELGYTTEQLARICGVPIGTLQKIFSGETKSPRRETVLALESILGPNLPEPLVVREEGLVYTVNPGNKTYQDYLNLPEGVRVELINGRFYDLGAPTIDHQFISDEIAYRLSSFVRQNRKKCCRVFMAPFDVVIKQDNRHCVQPDVMICCDKSQTKTGVLRGAPAFVLEVLSPSTRSRDLGEKVTLYSETGVKEYWLVDPKARKAMVYIFDGTFEFPTIYGAEDKVPVHVWDNEHSIDFKEVFAALDDWMND